MDTIPPSGPPPTPVAPHLLLEDSVEAAKNAPPDPADADLPRHPTAPVFRMVNNQYTYIEEGELESNQHVDLRRRLRDRG